MANDMSVGKPKINYLNVSDKVENKKTNYSDPKSESVNQIAVKTLSDAYAEAETTPAETSKKPKLVIKKLAVEKEESTEAGQRKLDLKNEEAMTSSSKLKVLSSFSSKILSNYAFVNQKETKEDLKAIQLEESIKNLSKNEIPVRQGRFKTVRKTTKNNNELIPKSAVITVGISKLLHNVVSEELKLTWEEKSELKIAKGKQIDTLKKDLGKTLEPQLRIQAKIAMTALDEYAQVKKSQGNTVNKSLSELQDLLRTTKNGDYIGGVPEDDLFHSSYIVENLEKSSGKFLDSLPENYKNKIFNDIEEEFSSIIDKTKDEIDQYNLSIKTNSQDTFTKTPSEIAGTLTRRINNYLDKKLSPVIFEIRDVTGPILNDVTYLIDNKVPLSLEVYKDGERIRSQMQQTGLEAGFQGVISKHV